MTPARYKVLTMVTTDPYHFVKVF
jgi:hypothetical protein